MTNKLKTVDLKIRRKPFEQITSGQKTKEYRAFSPYYIDRIGKLMPAHDDEPIDFLIKLSNGYSKDSPYLIVRCTDVTIEPCDNDMAIHIEDDGSYWLIPDSIPEEGDITDDDMTPCDESNTHFVLHLAEIIEVSA